MPFISRSWVLAKQLPDLPMEPTRRLSCVILSLRRAAHWHVMRRSAWFVFGLLGGILLTIRGRLWAGYWLATSIAIFAFLGFVHFVGFEPNTAETRYVIAMSYRLTRSSQCSVSSVPWLRLRRFAVSRV